MMGYWWLFLLGLLGGWLIELAIDYTWWRKRHRASADEAARRLGEIEQFRKEVESREARLALRERDAGERETVQSGRDADLLLQAKRIDERGEAILRTEQRLDGRRVELEKLATSLGERDRTSNERLHVIKLAETRFADRQSRLDAADVEAAKREAMLGSRESGIKRWEQRILAKEKELHGLEAEAARAARDAERWRRQYHGMRALIDQRYRRDDGADDLGIIQGINRHAETLLNDLGITSFVRLAETPLGELSRLAEQGGPDLALADPMSWAEQAALLVDRDFIGFETLKAKLRGDVSADERLAATDIALESGPPLADDDAVDGGGPDEARAGQGRPVADEGQWSERDDDVLVIVADRAPAAVRSDAVSDGAAPGSLPVEAAPGERDADEAVSDGVASGDLTTASSSGIEPLVITSDSSESVGSDSVGFEPVGSGSTLNVSIESDSAAVEQVAESGDAFRLTADPKPVDGSKGEADDAPSAVLTTEAPVPSIASARPRSPRGKPRAARPQKVADVSQAKSLADVPPDAAETPESVVLPESLVTPEAVSEAVADTREGRAEVGAAPQDDGAVPAHRDEAFERLTPENEVEQREVETITSSTAAPVGQPEAEPARRPERSPFSGQPSRGGGRRRRR